MTRPYSLRAIATAAFGAALFCSAPAQAAMIVYDPTSYAKMIEQARTALSQLESLKAQVAQGEALLGSLNDASGVGALASALDVPGIRAALPEVEALRGNLADLDDLGRRASALREHNRLYAPGGAKGALGDLGDLEAIGDRAARDIAIGEAVMTAGARRLDALQDLQGRIDTAPNARAVLDLQARLAAEQAVIANEQMRLQGLAMAQEAESRLQAQRDRERVAAKRAARMEVLRRGLK